jgi:HD-GYP domain-containing protein (c-di-GMP phosphodiesterase class II)
MSRVVSVADAFDAMMSDRRYRSKLDLESAISQLQGGAGTQFDAKVVEKFVSMLEDYQQMEVKCAYPSIIPDKQNSSITRRFKLSRQPLAKTTHIA